MYENATREELAKLFLPKNQNKLIGLTDEKLNEITKKLLGCDVIEKIPCVQKDDHSDACCTSSKYYEFFGTYQKYASIFDLCRTIGVNNIYDIGNYFINQSFLLHDSPNVVYTGISGGGFALMDYRYMIDEKNRNYHYVISDEVPSFCNGRIRFTRGEYPFVDVPYTPNNIAVAIHSIGTYNMYGKTLEEMSDEIKPIAQGVTKDFDRVLMDIYGNSYENPYEYLDLWKEYMPGFEFYKVMTNFSKHIIFATKCSEDIDKLRSDESYKPVPVQPWIADDFSIYDFNIVNRHKWEGQPYNYEYVKKCEGCIRLKAGY